MNSPEDNVTDLGPILTKEDYVLALADIERYFDIEPVRGTPEAARFDLLASLIEAYENSRWPIGDP
ncbi:MAG: family transcriptional regulator [Devosia sp.]|uniref:transcriptional regulator n=1 Tax=Devosia sp. TaxID=1871048 RepID=UPI00260B8CD9|nr:transcriptional regulator [Devosia sp.]MDB5538716.1 family transcriptional regulator [Devosia sp.]